MVSLPELINPASKEAIPIIERPTSPEIPPEIDSYVQKVEKEAELSQPVTYQGQTLVTSPAAQNIKITLPLNKTQIEWGLRQKIAYPIRWLAEWCLRIIKKAARLGRDVVYSS